MAHKVMELEPRVAIKRGKDGKTAKEERFPRFSINIDGQVVYLELHLGENGASHEVLEAIRGNRLLTYSTLEQDLAGFCKDQTKLIMVKGPFAEVGEGFQIKQIRKRGGIEINVPLGNEQTYIGVRLVPCPEENRLPEPGGSTESDYVAILQRLSTKNDPLKAVQISISEALKHWGCLDSA